MTAVALVGVTASGKSASAMDFALGRGDIEIVSVDSMCVYRGMDLATSKPSRRDQSLVPHHLIDLVEPNEEFTVTQFQDAARQAMGDIAARGHHALLVGGTGLYLRAVVDDLAFPGRFPDVASALEAELDDGRSLVPDLHLRLAGLDPQAASRMEPTNRRRVLRALEVTLGSGRPFSAFGPGLEAYPPSAVPLVGLAVEPDVVDARIAERLAAWLDAGLVEEVRTLASHPGGISRTARQALGYREILAHIEEGRPLLECVEEAVRRTRTFARRQTSWFRRDPRIAWAQDATEANELLGQALEAHGQAD